MNPVLRTLKKKAPEAIRGHKMRPCLENNRHKQEKNQLGEVVQAEVIEEGIEAGWCGR